MRAYVATTGALSALLVAAHVVRAIQEPHLARDPWFLASSVLALALAAWAARLLASRRRGP